MIKTEQSNVDNLNQQYKAALDTLYHNGKPIYPEGAMAQKTEEINLVYLQDLHNIRKAAQEQKERANDLEARSNQDPASFLTDSELSAVEARKGIVSKEAQNMSIDDFIRVAGNAGRAGKASSLAYFQALEDVEPQNKRQQEAVAETRQKLRNSIVPQELRNAKEEAARLRINAEIERVKVKETIHSLSGTPVGNYNPFSD